MHTHSLRVLRLLLAALTAGLAPVAAAEQPAGAPNYAGATATQLIPYENATSKGQRFTASLKFRFSVDGKSYLVTMDTGTTGIMLSAKDLPGYSPQEAARFPRGWEFLSSSKLLWVGRWIPKDVTFHGPQGEPVTATVPVLAVEQEVYCPDYYKGKERGPACPHKKLEPASSGITYMGVGFGREHDGQPQGTPDKNPFLNITKINGAPVAPGTMRSGYIITDRGVHVGLTAGNTSGFAFTALTGPKYSSDPRDWPEAPICVAVDESPCVPGRVLVDTGIIQMYLTVPPQVPVKTVSATDLSDKDKKVNVLADKSRVTVRFPGQDDPIAFYTFTVGDGTNPMQPAQVITSQKGTVAFVNTGLHFLRNFNVLYDADGGLFGLKWTGPANSPQGGLTPTR
jgi:hypothetical protein